jgi:hypothetical protein
MTTKRKYPVGIQSFEKLRTQGHLYVDKTSLVYTFIDAIKTFYAGVPYKKKRNSLKRDNFY